MRMLPSMQEIQARQVRTAITARGNPEYVINQVKEQGQVPAGAVEDLTISVAVNGKDPRRSDNEPAEGVDWQCGLASPPKHRTRK